MGIPVAKEGWPFILFSLFLSLLALLTGFLLSAGLLFLLTLFILFFFRDFERAIPSDQKVIVSPADGKIINIREIPIEENLGSPSIRLSIFMSIFNCHVNRAPFDGKVVKKIYNPGKFLPAFREKVSELNEQTTIYLNTKAGLLRVTQIAGLIARRIICRVQEENKIQKGERFGLIKFGSRVDLYVPKNNIQIKAKVGDKVKAGETVLARIIN